MTFREWLIDRHACEPALEWVGDRTLEQAWAECPRGDWMEWLFFEVAHRTNSWSEYDDLIHKWDELYWSSLNTPWRAAAAAPGFDHLKGRKILMGLMAAFFRSIQPTAPGPKL